MLYMITVSIKGLALAFLAFGFGYIVCVVASKEKGILKVIGYIIGVAIIAFSIAAVILKICTHIPCEETKRKVISDPLGPKRMVDTRGPMAPPQK